MIYDIKDSYNDTAANLSQQNIFIFIDEDHFYSFYAKTSKAEDVYQNTCSVMHTGSLRIIHERTVIDMFRLAAADGF